jgi:hypothetical protein
MEARVRQTDRPSQFLEHELLVPRLQRLEHPAHEGFVEEIVSELDAAA